MSQNDISTLIAAISAVVSIIALARASQGVKLSQAQVETAIRDQINGAMRRFEDFAEDHGDFLDRDVATLSGPEKRKYARAVAGMHSRNEAYLTALDLACGKYRDGKIDRVRFKKDYQRDIRQAVQNKAHEEYFKVGHGFNALMAVYQKWENPEKD